MKKIYSFVTLSILALTVHAQLVINENFTGYTPTPGPLGTQGGWVQLGSGQDVQIINDGNSLVYTGYTAGTQYATIARVDGTDPRKAFSLPINTSGDRVIYVSFLVRVSSAPEGNENPVQAISLENTANTNYPLKFYIREVQGSGT